MKHIAKIAICATALTAVMSEPAQAAFTLVKRMSSANGNIVVGEFSRPFDQNNSDQFGDVGYEVDVANGVSLHILIVSHTEQFAGAEEPDGWGSFNLSKNDWATTEFAGTTGANIGAFESLFGMVDTYVIVYRVTTDETTPVLKDTNSLFPGLEDVEESEWSSTSFLPRFRRNSGPPLTQFVALDTNGMIIGQSIPEPSAALLILSGCMVFLRRRR